MKKIIIITIFIFLLFGTWQNVYAADLLLDYPAIKDAKSPSEDPSLPQMIKYIYLFSLGIVGFVALLSILIGAVQYITSAGNSSKAGEAKERITSAILGILILLAAVLILRTINPDLIKLEIKLPKLNLSERPPAQPGECYISDLTWSENEINAGESATLRINWDKNDCKDEVLKGFEIEIKHQGPGAKTDWSCKKLKINILQNSFPNTPPFEYEYIFNDKCNCSSGKIICNLANNLTEIFYAQGEIQLKGRVPQGLYKTIGVNDLKGDGTCCK